MPFKRNSSFLKIKKWPARFQWRQFFKILTRKERISFFVFFILFIISFAFVLSSLYLKNTEIRPDFGGSHTEGVIGQPRFINPIYANSDVDRDLVQLIFSGLMKYDDNLQIVPDLINGYEVEERGKVYKFYLKEGILWHDKTPLTADDVIFTIRTIQNPDYKSLLRANWVGVEVEKINDLAVKFTLKKPYTAFLENSTVKILPKHIWQNIPAEDAPFESYNLKPVGSGPYKFRKIKEEIKHIESLTIERNSLYFDKKPYISEIKFSFFGNEKDLIEAAERNRIKGLSVSYPVKPNDGWQKYSISLPRYFALFFNPDKSKSLDEKKVRLALNHAIDKKEVVKKALGLLDNSPEIEKAVIDSPILPKVYGFDAPEEIYEFDIEKAKELLDEAGFKENENACPPSAGAEGDCRRGLREKVINKSPSFQFKSYLKKNSQGTEVQELQRCLAMFEDVYPEAEVSGYFGEKTEAAVIKFQEKYKEEILEPWGFSKGTGIVSKTTRSKLNEVCFDSKDEVLALKFSIITVDQPQLIKVAEEIKNQWKVMGIEVEIKKFPIFQLEQDFIKPREYEILLFGEVLGAVPDPLPFWHSSQKKDPGLNLADYGNKKTDELLEAIRQSSDPQSQTDNLITFQNILIKDAPVVFLYCPDYIYLASNEIQGINVKKITDPSKRFSQIEKWYIKTKRVWK